MGKGMFTMLASVLWLKGGAKGRNRTVDTSIFSAVLYQLSYLGVSARFRRPFKHSTRCCALHPECCAHCIAHFPALSRGLWHRLVM